MKMQSESRDKLRQTLAQIKHEVGALQAQLENAPQDMQNNWANKHEYSVDEYILKFRLGNVCDLAQHSLEMFVPKEKP